MNDAQVRAVPNMNGFEAQFRKVHRANWEAVAVNGIVQLYATAVEAENAAYQALMKHLFGDGILRSGDRASAVRSRAEEQFGKVFPGKGRKPVVVERR